ncbi:hypothetical protein N665_0470s0001 [Sinapis alba]|nr:hypothetical protein N665_0470s0001 [Sinapis alba]
MELTTLVLLSWNQIYAQRLDDLATFRNHRIGQAASCCVYEDDSYQAQEYKVERGVDIVVGTLGRIKDHTERRNLDLTYQQFCVLVDVFLIC